MSEQYTPDTRSIRNHWVESAIGVEELAEAHEEFDRWLDGVRAAARREGQAEALRAAASAKDSEFPTEDGYGRSAYVRTWLHARANQIENGADQ